MISGQRAGKRPPPAAQWATAAARSTAWPGSLPPRAGWGPLGRELRRSAGKGPRRARGSAGQARTLPRPRQHRGTQQRVAPRKSESSGLFRASLSRALDRPEQRLSALVGDCRRSVLTRRGDRVAPGCRGPTRKVWRSKACALTWHSCLFAPSRLCLRCAGPVWVHHLPGLHQGPRVEQEPRLLRALGRRRDWRALQVRCCCCGAGPEQAAAQGSASTASALPALPVLCQHCHWQSTRPRALPWPGCPLPFFLTPPAVLPPSHVRRACRTEYSQWFQSGRMSLFPNRVDTN